MRRVKNSFKGRGHGFLHQGAEDAEGLRRAIEIEEGRKNVPRGTKPDGMVRMWDCERCDGQGWVKDDDLQCRPTRPHDPNGVPCPNCRGTGVFGKVVE